MNKRIAVQKALATRVILPHFYYSWISPKFSVLSWLKSNLDHRKQSRTWMMDYSRETRVRFHFHMCRELSHIYVGSGDKRGFNNLSIHYRAKSGQIICLQFSIYSINCNPVLCLLGYYWITLCYPWIYLYFSYFFSHHLQR